MILIRKLFGSASLMTHGPILATLLLFGLAPGSSQANIMIVEGNDPQDNGNVLLERDQIGTTVFGLTNDTNTTVRFRSTQTLLTPAGGQARIEATVEESQVPLNNILIDVPNGTFESLIFNAFNGANVGDAGSLTISVLDNMSALTTLSFDLDRTGGNFFTITSDEEQSILSVSLSFSPPTSGFTDLRQVRIGGAAVTPVPEPSTLAAAMTGIACLSLAGFRKLRRRTAGAQA